MRILGIYVGECGTEWCRLADGHVAGGVHPDSGAVWALLKEELDRGPGSEEEPIMVAVGGQMSPVERGDLCIWEARTPYTDMELYAGWEISIANHAADRAIGKSADAMRRHGLLDADGPVRRAAAMALDMAARRGYD